MKQAKISKRIVLGLAIGLLNSGTVLANGEVQNAPDGNSDKSKDFDISIGTELMSGDTTYSIKVSP